MARLTSTEKRLRTEHMEQFPDCWLCPVLHRNQVQTTELHHIAGRPKGGECRENYASLCKKCHCILQSRYDAELVCLYLKHKFDRAHYSPERICELRRRSITCWTHNDVEHCHNLLKLFLDLVR